MRARPPGESAAGLRGSAGHGEVQLIWGGQDQPTLPATIHPTVHAAGGPARPALLQWPCTRRRCACRCCGPWGAVRRALWGVGGCAQSDEQKPGGRRAASTERGRLCPRHPALSSCGRHPQQHCLEVSRELGRTAGRRRHSGHSWPPRHLRGRVTGAGPRAGRSLGLGVMRERLTACRCGQSPGPPQYKRTLEPSGLLCQRRRGPCSRRGRRSEKAVSGQQSHQDGAPQMPRAAPWASHGPRVTPDALGAVPA